VVKERIDYCGVAAGRNLLLLVCTEQRQTHPDILGSSFHGFAVAQWLRCYKLEDRGFDSRQCHRNFSLTQSRSHYGPEVGSASNRNEYQEYFLGVKAVGA